MTVEEVRGNSEGGDRNYDKFPVGMRVLAVDDDPICLRLLEGLLRKCQYHVTTTSQARMALKLLRENKDRFDLVISDVHMPDMDGFKLLELVGLEMDLPVIMLSANSDPKLVMKGVTHGACDYLVKPVRIEELRNIWQHVIRRKKFDSKKQSKSTYEDKALHGNGEVCQGPLQTSNADQTGKINKKRKDEEDEVEENGHEQEDPATQKKPRVVWSIELHRKFVAAVNQLGIEKAVPKRILDLMNVEGLTRENVASHLQKYRLYLKRISSVATQQANMVAAFGGKDAAYMRMNTLDGLGDFRTLSGSGRLASTPFSSYAQGGMLGRLNSPAGINLRNLASSTLVQPSHSPNVCNSISSLGKLHPGVSPVSRSASVFQGVPSSLQLDQLQQNKSGTHVGDFNTTDDSRIFGAASAFTDSTALSVNSNTSLNGATNSTMIQGNSQQALAGGGFIDQSSVSMAPFQSESLSRDFHGSSKFLDHGRSNENWQSTVQLSKFPSNALASMESFSPGQLPLTNVIDNPLGFSSSSTTSAPLEDSKGEMHCQEGLVGGSVQNMSQVPGQRWGEPKQNYPHSSNNVFSNLNTQGSGVISPLTQSLGQNGFMHRTMDVCLSAQSSVGSSTFLQQSEIENPTTGLRTRSSEDYILEQIKPQGGFVPNSYDSLDDLMSAIKREQDENMLDGDIGFNPYQFGPCI